MPVDESAPASNLKSQSSKLKSSDVIVIGAGPAGTSVSILLAQAGLQVRLLEKSRFPREKLCGEFLSPETLPIFDRLGMRGQMMDAGAQTIRKWLLVAPNGRRIEVPLRWISEGGEAIGLSRARMDAILLARARECGVMVREGFHVSPRLARDSGLTMIEGRADGDTIERYAGRLIIDASGRQSVFARQQFAPQKSASGSRPFGVKVHLRGVEGLNDSGELFFFRDGYGGLSAVEGGRTNLCFITTENHLRAARGDRHALLEMTMLTSPAARDRLRGAVPDGAWLGTGPLEYGRRASVPGVLAIGDAGAFIDPFTGSGMLLALTSGELAAQVISESFAAGAMQPEQVISRYQQIHRHYFNWRLRACALLRRLAFKPATRNVLALLLERHSALARLAALSTRH